MKLGGRETAGEVEGVINELITSRNDGPIFSDMIGRLKGRMVVVEDFGPYEGLQIKIPGAENFPPAIVKTFPLISTGTHCVRAGRCQSVKQDNTHLEKASKWIRA